MFKHDLKPGVGANKEKRRVGRGTGSGLGTTAGKGHKGMKARAGKKETPGFEGGQMPMIRRVPKRGFNNARFATVYEVVNLNDINACFNAGEEVNITSLKFHGLVHGNKDGIKILGDGELTKALKFNVDKVSASAAGKIESAGGSISLVPVFTDNEAVRVRKEARAQARASKLATKKK